MTALTFAVDTAKDSYDDVRGIIDRLFDKIPAPAPDATEPGDVEGNGTGWTIGQTVWTAPKMRRYCAVLTEGGQKALRSMVDHGPHVLMDDVQADVGMDGTVFAGMMSTFGHARNGTRGVHDLPFVRNGRAYYIPPQIAALADEALQDLGV
jgi:hypothetical protein